MKLDFDRKADAAYIRFNDSPIVESEEVSPGVVYDFDEHGQVVGVELLKLKHRTAEQLQSLHLPFTPEDKEQLKTFFSLFRYVAA